MLFTKQGGRSRKLASATRRLAPCESSLAVAAAAAACGRPGNPGRRRRRLSLLARLSTRPIGAGRPAEGGHNNLGSGRNYSSHHREKGRRPCGNLLGQEGRGGRSLGIAQDRSGEGTHVTYAARLSDLSSTALRFVSRHDTPPDSVSGNGQRREDTAFDVCYYSTEYIINNPCVRFL